MKILRLTTELNYGGIEKVFELHATYNNTSDELVFVALGKGGATAKILEGLGYRVIILNSRKVAIPSFKVIVKLIKLFKLEKPDVIHTSGAEANFHATIAARLSGSSGIICEEIGIPKHSLKAKQIFRLTYTFSKKVIAISKAVQQFLVISKEAPERKVQLIYNPVNDKKYEGEQVPREKMLFSVVARLEPVKNVSLLIDAFVYILDVAPDAKLVIIGDGSLRKELEEQARHLGIEANVDFKGFVANPQPELLRSSFFVLPSLFEGFGLACIEAIQAGNVVICTSSGGIPEFINDGEQGFLFDPKSKEDLVLAMKRAIGLSEQDKSKMIGTAQLRVSQMFSPTKYINELHNLYHAVGGSRNRLN